MPLSPDPDCRSLTAWSASAISVMWLSLSVGCAHNDPQNLPPSATTAAIEQHMGKPTLILPRTAGGVRWVFAKGPYGRHTWMLDMDTSGRLESWHQALGEAQFSDLPAGMDREALLLRLGPPADKRARGLMPGEVWSYRYPTNNCLWFQVTLGPDHKVVDGSYGIDPRCDAPTKAGD